MSWVLKIEGQYVTGWYALRVGPWRPCLDDDRGRAWRFFTLPNARAVRGHIPRAKIFRLKRSTKA